MVKEAKEIQQGCSTCQEHPSREECNFTNVVTDWQQPYLDFISEGALPAENIDAALVKKRAPRFFINEGQLYRRGFNGKALKCLAGQEVQEVLQQVHQFEHQGGYKLYQQLLHLGYYWPTMEKEAMEFAKRCVACQKHANSIHAPAVALKSLTTPWPFHTWSMDLMGALNPSKGKIWILAATKLFTK